jgi:hypothetical protein
LLFWGCQMQTDLNPWVHGKSKSITVLSECRCRGQKTEKVVSGRTLSWGTRGFIYLDSSRQALDSGPALKLPVLCGNLSRDPFNSASNGRHGAVCVFSPSCIQLIRWSCCVR